MNTKICTKCKYEKLVSEFWKNKSGKFGVTTRCKECHKTQKTKERQLRLLKIPKGFKQCTKCKETKNIKEFQLSNRYADKHKCTCKKCDCKYSRNYRYRKLKENPLFDKNNRLRQNFGIDLKKYNEILQEQNGVCAICGKTESALSMEKNEIKALAVDHNHKTGKVRGLLCQKCNIGLGHFCDDINFLKLTIKYLERN